MSVPQQIERDGFTVRVYRHGFKSGYYVEVLDADGNRLAFTGVYRGKGSKEKAIRSGIRQALTGEHSPDDCGISG